MTITDRTLDVVFSRFRVFSFSINLRQKPKEVTRMRCRTGSFSRTPFGFYLRVIVNEKPPNLEKTTSNVLYVIVNYSMDQSI